ncbi:hypothetical protein QBC47DRAFT_400989 [Echria macrotheca]|uniref:Nonsense-mediated mRNA decay factor n=1 Tax=Echria macrotheca TaxID=438768 RepID=A0AAJ0F6V2_9PEZI|nr:hypothetical protein QBC47DRAFT_400989 [Echria macrotheca]
MASPTATTQSPAPVADTAALLEKLENGWKHAQRQRALIYKQLDRIEKLGKDGEGAMNGFDLVEEALPNFRLSCLQIIMADVLFAKENNVEEILWATHIYVAKTYRKVISNLHGDFIVLRRKVTKLYHTFLKTSQSFYRAYLQRFCGSYKMKDLERVAQVVKFDTPIEEVVPVKDADPEVQKAVDLSFHKTLIYLGDLSRYRTLLRPQDRTYEPALTYYALASELMPESGHGYHQAAVIYSEINDRLGLVYSLYRALACDKPHPLAQKNLEREFRDLREPKQGSARPGGLHDPVEAMVSWFVKLHAYYFQGDEFTASKEMEAEVDNRLTRTLKSGAGANTDNVLLKMVLVNITAYVVGKQRVQAEWTDAKSRSCQTILRLNVRTIESLSKLLRDQLLDLIQQKASPDSVGAAQSAHDGKKETKFTAAFHRILPLFRVYMAWLCFYSPELTDFRVFLEPQFGSMCKVLAHTLTLSLEWLKNGPDAEQSVRWLFPEDEETVGIRCLNGPELDDGCRLRYDALKLQPKPRADEVPGADFSPDTAAWIRLFDVALCALRLAGHSPFPIIFSNGSFSYVEQGATHAVAPPPAAQVPEIEAVAPAAMGPVPQNVAPLPQPVEKTVAQVPVLAEAESEEAYSSDEEFFPTKNTKASTAGPHRPEPAVEPLETASTSEYPVDTMMSKLINEFLTPPELSAGRQKPQQETSYGMGSRTANDIWAPYTTSSPTPGSATSKAFPSLPWGYFLPADAQGTGARNLPRVQSGGSGWHSRSGSGGSAIPAPNTAQVSNPLTLPVHQLDGSSATFPFTNQYAQDWLAQSGRDAKARDSLALQARNIREVWAKPEQNSASHGRKPSGSSSPWSPSGGPWQPQNERGAASGGQTSPFSSGFAFSAESSMPQVNSPRGIPPVQPQGQTVQPQGQAHRSWVETAQTSTMYGNKVPSAGGLGYMYGPPRWNAAPPGFSSQRAGLDPSMTDGQSNTGELTSPRAYGGEQPGGSSGQPVWTSWVTDNERELVQATREDVLRRAWASAEAAHAEWTRYFGMERNQRP